MKEGFLEGGRLKEERLREKGKGVERKGGFFAYNNSNCHIYTCIYIHVYYMTIYTCIQYMSVTVTLLQSTDPDAWTLDLPPSPDISVGSSQGARILEDGSLEVTRENEDR